MGSSVVGLVFVGCASRLSLLVVGRPLFFSRETTPGLRRLNRGRYTQPRWCRILTVFQSEFTSFNKLPTTKTKNGLPRTFVWTQPRVRYEVCSQIRTRTGSRMLGLD